jgi:Zn-dependent M16 (insulinase) family peptidase
MKEIRERVFSISNLTLSLTMDDSVMKEHIPHLSAFWKQKLPTTPVTGALNCSLLEVLPYKQSLFSVPDTEGLAIQATVGFVAKCLRGASLTDPQAAPQILLSHLLKTGPLWEKIRMKGGAYGAFSTHSGLDQVFTFGTYRDPEIILSLDAFRESLEEFTDFKDEGELEKSLISVVGKEMRPQSPSEKSMMVLKRYLYEITDDLRQKKRDLLMSCTIFQVQDACRGLLSRWDEDAVSVMAHPDKLDIAAKTRAGLKENRIELPQ